MNCGEFSRVSGIRWQSGPMRNACWLGGGRTGAESRRSATEWLFQGRPDDLGELLVLEVLIGSVEVAVAIHPQGEAVHVSGAQMHVVMALDEQLIQLAAACADVARLAVGLVVKRGVVPEEGEVAQRVVGGVKLAAGRVGSAGQVGALFAFGAAFGVAVGAVAIEDGLDEDGITEGLGALAFRRDERGFAAQRGGLAVAGAIAAGG